MTDRLQEATADPREGTLRLLLLLILAFSLFIQLTVVSRTTVDTPLRADAREYFSYAFNLRNHGTFSLSDTWSPRANSTVPVPDSVRTPGYPLFLALIGNPAPNDAYVRRVELVQASLGVLSVWLLYLVSADFLGRAWALAPAGLAAISPHLATISTYLLSESLFYFLLLSSVLATQRALRSKRSLSFVLAGCVWGLCSLVRPTVEFLPLLVLAAALLVTSWQKFRVGMLLAILGFSLVMAPWAIRNQLPAVSTPSATLMVKSILHGSYPGFMYEGKADSLGFPYRADPGSESKSRDLPTVLAYVAGQFRSQPATYLQWYLVGKPIYFLSWGEVQGWDVLIYPVIHTPYYEDVRFASLRMASFVLHWPLVILGLFACLLLWLRRGPLRLDQAALTAAILVSLVVAYAIAIHMVAAPFPRYGVPFRPLLFALAMLPLRAAWLRRKPGQARRPA